MRMPQDLSRAAGVRDARVALVVVAMFGLVSCNGAGVATPSPDPADGSSPTTPGTAAASDPATSGEPTFDLSGVELTITVSHESPMGSLERSLELLEEWGAVIDKVETGEGLQALLAGESDIAGQHGADELIIAFAQGADVIGIGTSTANLEDVLLGGGDYEEISDLEGTTIATSGPGGFSHLMAALVLRSGGLDPDEDVTFASIGGSSERAAAVLAGQASAGIVAFDLWLTVSEQSDDVRIVATLAEALPEFNGPVYYAMRSFWEENPEVALAWACANLEANEWSGADQQRYVDFWLERLPERTPESLEGTWQFQVDNNSWPTEPDEVMSVEGLQQYSDSLVETGDISAPIDASEILDFSYLEEAKSMGCGG